MKGFCRGPDAPKQTWINRITNDRGSSSGVSVWPNALWMPNVKMGIGVYRTDKMRAGPRAVPRLGGPQIRRNYAGISYGHKCNYVKVTNALFLLSCNYQRRSVVQLDSATVESGNRYSVTELAQHQQRTAVMPTSYVTSLFYAAGRVGAGRTLVGFGPGWLFSARVHL